MFKSSQLTQRKADKEEKGNRDETNRKIAMLDLNSVIPIITLNTKSINMSTAEIGILDKTE